MFRRKPIYLVITLMFFILLAYLGVRTLEHEVLLRQYQTQTLAKSQTASVARGSKIFCSKKPPACMRLAILSTPQRSPPSARLKRTTATLPTSLCCGKIISFTPMSVSR